MYNIKQNLLDTQTTISNRIDELKEDYVANGNEVLSLLKLQKMNSTTLQKLASVDKDADMADISCISDWMTDMEVFELLERCFMFYFTSQDFAERPQDKRESFAMLFQRLRHIFGGTEIYF